MLATHVWEHEFSLTRTHTKLWVFLGFFKLWHCDYFQRNYKTQALENESVYSLDSEAAEANGLTPFWRATVHQLPGMWYSCSGGPHLCNLPVIHPAPRNPCFLFTLPFIEDYAKLLEFSDKIWVLHVKLEANGASNVAVSSTVSDDETGISIYRSFSLTSIYIT